MKKASKIYSKKLPLIKLEKYMSFILIIEIYVFITSLLFFFFFKKDFYLRERAHMRERKSMSRGWAKGEGQAEFQLSREPDVRFDPRTLR